MSKWYDREGNPIPDLLTWGRMLEDREYQRVASTKLDNGKWVSTVWLGLDHSFGFGDGPLIFETMVFDKNGEECDTDRYSIEQQAIVGPAPHSV